MSAQPVETPPPPGPPARRARDTVKGVDQDALRSLLRHMPRAAVERAQQLDERVFARRETTAERNAREAEARAARGRTWEANVPPRYRDARVDALDPDQHPDAARAWLASDSPMLVLASTTVGNGKTHTAYALGWAAHTAGRWVAAWTMADLNAALRPGEYEPEAWPTATGCALLIIDDIGQERLTDWTKEQLHRLLDQRGREQKRTIVTTNKTSLQIEQIYGAPIADRLLDDAVALKFTGTTRRKPRAW